MTTSEGKKVRVRIAPSPTGFAHVGTAYAALFNYAFAKNMDGKFIIRLEDTDTKRHVKGAEQAIYDSFTWLGFSWDEGPDKGGEYAPYRQSERLETYKEKAKKLLEEGKAYEDDGAIRFKNPGEDIGWKDIVRDDIKFPGGEITDFVIMKSDGFPTYNFAVVIDDLLMEITHVIRGEEHISNTPRQLALYKALNEKAPKFAHLPTLRNKERKKLSKREDPVDLGIYQKEGYLPEAFINFLCLLGWSHPKEKEIFSLSEFVKSFSLERVRKAGPIFDKEKLDWINGEYLRKLEDAVFVDKIWEFYNGKYSQGEIAKVASLIKERIKTFSEFKTLAGFFFEEPKVDKKLFGKGHKEHLKMATEILENVSEWSKATIDEELLAGIERNKFKTGDFFMTLRIAITGKKFTPPINDSIVILGKEESLKRLKKFAK